MVDNPPNAPLNKELVEQAIHHATSGLSHPEDRPGQREMAFAVMDAINSKQPLIVQAGTGTGKTIAYLVPAILSGKRIVVSTATKTLQDQLALHDLPLLEATLPQPFTWAVLKGRSNYVCMQRITEVHDDGQLELDDLAIATKKEVKELVKWAEKSPTGDIAELDWQPHHKAWQSVSVGSDECPGAAKCPSGGQCFAEHAKYRAAASDVVVVNTHLYGIHVASGGAILPEHEVVIFDEAHQLEDTLTATVGVTISASRATTLATAMNKVVEDDKLLTELFDAAALLRTLFAPHIETRLSLPLPVDIVERLNALRLTVNSCLDALRKIESTLETVRQKVLRAQTLATRFADDLDAVLRVSATSVPFVSGTTERPELVIAPLNVGPILAEFVWPLHTAIMTSATIPLSMPERIGLSPDKVHVLDVGSPFNYEEQGRLYCATHLPDPNAQRDDAVHDELATLITAAGGRTLALFTSRRALTSAVEEMRKRLPFRILAQDENQKPSLLRDFLLDETSCLFATAGFFEGVDIPGRALSLVVIDRIPFPHRNNPLLAARRDLHGSKGFTEIDLPRAITALAQATGRLIRTRTDKGVVAVLDPRLATKSYRWAIINALPPLKRIKDINEATEFLKEITQ
jgi:ATP-dependent DNA helicase DinG